LRLKWDSTGQEKFSEGRRIRQRVPVLGYRVPLFSNLQVKI
jgi:hypothetical protein